MEITYKKNTKWSEPDTCELVVIEDKDGNRYRISQDRLGGIEIIAEDGRVAIEPTVSNHITIKTL